MATGVPVGPGRGNYEFLNLGDFSTLDVRYGQETRASMRHPKVTVTQRTRRKQITSILGHSVTIGCYMLATMLLLEYLWSGSISGLVFYVMITGLFVATLTLVRCKATSRRALKA